MTDIKNKVRIAMKALMSGLPIEIEGRVYRMSEDYDVAIEMEQYTLKDGVVTNHRKTYMPTFMTVSAFINMVERMSEEEVVNLVGTLALNDV